MSTPSYRLINPQADSSFIFKWEPLDLKNRWHYHPELELIYFTEGKTNAVMGDGFFQFQEGDLVLLGANFPHVLKEDAEFSRLSPGCKPFGLVVQFTEEFLGHEFWMKPETESMIRMVRKAQRGLYFRKNIVRCISASLTDMHKLSPTRKLIALLDTLVTLSEMDDYEFMTPDNYFYDHTQDEDRMRNINQYIYEHFKEPISISEIAGVANMTESSFCRYFKIRTRKTFTQLLNETRVAYACRLLNNEKNSVTSACFESGFNSLSYFTRQFKTITRMSPQRYRNWKRTTTS